MSEETPWTVDQWRDWVRMEADPYGLESDCIEYFERVLKAGDHPSIAAQGALEEWDLLA